MKVVTETESQKKLRELKKLKEEQGGLAAEEAALEMQEKAISNQAANLNKLKAEQISLSKKEVFKPPGVNGNIYKKVILKDGTEEYNVFDLEK